VWLRCGEGINRFREFLGIIEEIGVELQIGGVREPPSGSYPCRKQLAGKGI
jgi:hypothetical protein